MQFGRCHRSIGLAGKSLPKFLLPALYQRCNNQDISNSAPLGVEAVPDVVAVPVNPDDLSVVVDAQSFSAVRAVGINLSRMGLLSGSVSEPKVPPLRCRSWETVPAC